MSKKEEAVVAEPVFSKEQILESNRYKHQADWLGAILLPENSYTFKQVDDAIEKEMKRKVETC